MILASVTLYDYGGRKSKTVTRTKLGKTYRTISTRADDVKIISKKRYFKTESQAQGWQRAQFRAFEKQRRKSVDFTSSVQAFEGKVQNRYIGSLHMDASVGRASRIYSVKKGDEYKRYLSFNKRRKVKQTFKQWLDREYTRKRDLQKIEFRKNTDNLSPRLKYKKELQTKAVKQSRKEIE